RTMPRAGQSRPDERSCPPAASIRSPVWVARTARCTAPRRQRRRAPEGSDATSSARTDDRGRPRAPDDRCHRCGALRSHSVDVMEAALPRNARSKRFGTKVAVDQLSLQVPAGSMFGLVGPNGAGKTTTLSMATGLLRPDGGQAQVLGHDVWTDPPAAKAAMGVLPDGLRMFDRLSGRELITYSGRLRRVNEDDIVQRREALLDALGLTEDADKLVIDYSAGMTKKVALACALIHAPRLIVLDEPFEAVDPVSGDRIRTILRNFVGSGGTVIFSSHVM